MQDDDAGATISAAVARLDPHGFVDGVRAGVWFVVEPQVLAPVAQGVRGASRVWLRLGCVAVCRDGVGRGIDTRHGAGEDAQASAARVVAETAADWGEGEDGHRQSFVDMMARLATVLAACDCKPGAQGTRVLTLAGCVSHMTGMSVDDPAVLSACRASTRRLGMRLSAYLGALDARAVRLLAEHGGVGGVAAGCWSGLDGRMSPDAPLAAAWEAMPAHALALAEAWLASPARFRAEMALGRLDRLAGGQVVASGHLPARLVPTLARIDRLFGEQPAMAGPLGRAQSIDHPASRYGVPLSLARRLAALPAGWEPADDAECLALVGLVPVIDRAVSWTRGGDALARFLNAGGRWSAYAARLRAATDGGDAVSAMDDCLDMVRAFQRQVLSPAVLSAGMNRGDLAHVTSWSSAAWLTLLSGRSLPAVLEASARWHRTSGTMDAAYADAMSATGGSPPWGAGLPDASYGDVSVRVITDDVALLAEGSRSAADGASGLAHCVGGYGPDCRSGTVRVASVRRLHRDGTWSRLSTASFRMGPGGRPALDQHRGFGNVDPPADAATAIQAYVRDLRSGTLAIDVPGLARVPEPTVPGWSGAVPLEGGAWARVRDAWAPLLPRPLRLVDADTLARLAKAGVVTCRPMWLPETPGTPAYSAVLSRLPARPGPVRRR